MSPNWGDTPFFVMDSLYGIGDVPKLGSLGSVKECSCITKSCRKLQLLVIIVSASSFLSVDTNSYIVVNF